MIGPGRNVATKAWGRGAAADSPYSRPCFACAHAHWRARGFNLRLAFIVIIVCAPPVVVVSAARLHHSIHMALTHTHTYGRRRGKAPQTES